jgi:hypothetical protein
MSSLKVMGSGQGVFLFVTGLKSGQVSISSSTPAFFLCLFATGLKKGEDRGQTMSRQTYEK